MCTAQLEVLLLLLLLLLVLLLPAKGARGGLLRARGCCGPGDPTNPPAPAASPALAGPPHVRIEVGRRRGVPAARTGP